MDDRERMGPLSECAPGVCAVVVSVECEQRFRLRLADMGFTPGAPVLVVRCAPLGDPLEVEVRGYRVCLRRAEAAGILVETAEGGCCRRRWRRGGRRGGAAAHRPCGEP